MGASAGGSTLPEWLCHTRVPPAPPALRAQSGQKGRAGRQKAGSEGSFITQPSYSTIQLPSSTPPASPIREVVAWASGGGDARFTSVLGTPNSP